MEFSRSGMHRDHGAKSLLKKEPDKVSLYFDRELDRVVIKSVANRKAKGEASYRYVLKLEPELVLRALTAIPPEELAAAVQGNIPRYVARSIGALAAGLVACETEEPQQEEEEEMEERFRSWTDDGKLLIGRAVDSVIVQHRVEPYHVGTGKPRPYRNEIRYRWQGTSRIVAILRPAEVGVLLELRVGKNNSKQLIRDHSSFITPTKDGSTNAGNKVMINLRSLPLPEDFPTWVQWACESTSPKPVASKV